MATKIHTPAARGRMESTASSPAQKEKKTGKSGRGRPRAFNKHEALCAALKLFWEQGYEHATMKELAQAMGITSPSIYCAFGNKQALFLEALFYYRETYWEPHFAAFRDSENIYEGLATLLEATPDILLSTEAPCGCLAIHTSMSLSVKENTIREIVAGMRKQTHDLFEEKIRDDMKKGNLPQNLNVEVLSGAIANFFEGLAIQARLNTSSSKLKQIAATGLSLLPAREK